MCVPGNAKRDGRGPGQEGRGDPQQFVAIPHRHAFSREARSQVPGLGVNAKRPEAPPLLGEGLSNS